VTKIFQDETLFGILNFGHWKLFDICDLIFVIFELPTNQFPSGDKTKLGPLDQDPLLEGWFNIKITDFIKESFITYF